MGALLTFLRRARGDRRGVTAVEFALIAPVLISFYVCCVEISLMLQADRKVTSVASAVGDLVAQDDRVSADEIDDIFTVARAIMVPFDSTWMRMRVSSIGMDTDGTTHVRWSRGRNISEFACDSQIETPDGLLAPGQSVVMAEVQYDYDSPITGLVKGVMGMFENTAALDGEYFLEDLFYLRPRRSAEVSFNPDPC